MAKQLNITDFRYGLDARRSELTSRSGVCLQLNNGVVTQGAEIFKRKAWVKKLLSAGCFGLLATQDSSLVTFGSVATPAIFPVVVGGVTITYQQLVSPLGHAMTAFVGASLFNDEAFVIATFGTDGTYCFYNGVLIPDFTSGLVLAGETSDNAVASALVTLINETTSYTAKLYPNNAGSGILITGTNGAAYTTTSVVTSADSGTITEEQVNTPSTIANGQAATSQFTICAAGPTGVVAAVQYSLGTSGIGGGITSGGVNFVTDEPTTAAAVALNINANKAQTIVATTLTRARTANVATVVLSGVVDAFITPGSKVTIAGFTDASFNGANLTVLSSVSNTITYANNGSNVGTTNDTNGAVEGTGQYFTAISNNGTVVLTGPVSADANGWDIGVQVTGKMIVNSFAFAFAITSAAAFTVEAIGPGTSSAVSTDLLNSNPVAFSTSLALLVTTLANTINTQAVSDFVACDKGNVLWIGHTQAGSGVYDQPVELTMELASGYTGVAVVAHAGSTSTAGGGSSTTQALTAIASPSHVTSLATVVTCVVIGGTPPYTYQWFVNAAQNISVSPTSPTSPNTSFNISGVSVATTINTSFAGPPTLEVTGSTIISASTTAFCQVTDASGVNPVNSNNVTISV